jgi:lipopolysaccharide export LptBFGC system permease protein LptF
LTQQIAAERGVWDIDTGKWQLINIRYMRYVPNAKGGDVTFGASPSAENFPVGPSPQILHRNAKTIREHMIHGDYEVLSLVQLAAYRRDLIQELGTLTDPQDRTVQEHLINGVTYGIQDKVVTPFICLALVLVGCPLGLRPPRSSGNVAMGLSVMAIGFYYITWAFSQSLGSAGTANPYVMAYLSPVSTAAVGLVLLKLKSR